PTWLSSVTPTPGWEQAVRRPFTFGCSKPNPKHSERARTFLCGTLSPNGAEPARQLDEGVATENESAAKKQPPADRIVSHDYRQDRSEDRFKQVDQCRTTGGNAWLIGAHQMCGEDGAEYRQQQHVTGHGGLPKDLHQPEQPRNQLAPPDRPTHCQEQRR